MISIVLLAVAALLLAIAPFTAGPGQRGLCFAAAALALFVLLYSVIKF